VVADLQDVERSICHEALYWHRADRPVHFAAPTSVSPAVGSQPAPRSTTR